MARRGAFPRGDGAARTRRKPRPLDRPGLETLAFAYVARFQATATRLERYLARKLAERGWDDDGEPDPAALVRRCVEAGFVDDRAFAEAKSADLLRRGYGARRIGQALGEAGIAPEIREALQPGEAERRSAAMAMARKRRFGPFGADPPDRERREKQLAALVRAGHLFADARALVDAADILAAEQWVEKGEEE